jgi:hypothetical protein
MTVSMFKASAPIFVQFLTSLSVVLDKAAAHAEAKKIDPSVLLNTRLYPDMFPLVRQVRAATDHAISACGRLAGVELLTFANTESSIPELKDRIAKTIEFIKGFKPAQIDGTEDKEITIKFTSGERKFTGRSERGIGRWSSLAVYKMNQLVDGELLLTDDIFDQITDRDNSDQFSLVNDGQMANSLVDHYRHTFFHRLIGSGEQDLRLHNVPDPRGG